MEKKFHHKGHEEREGGNRRSIKSSKLNDLSSDSFCDFFVHFVPFVVKQIPSTWRLGGMI